MTHMKTDTEESIRVTVTFHRESNPEWYDLLANMKNGRARADVVRGHLSLPRFKAAVRVPMELPATALPQQPEKPSSAEMKTAEESTISVAVPKVNSSENFTGTSSEINEKEGQKKELGNMQKRGGMADMMLTGIPVSENGNTSL